MSTLTVVIPNYNHGQFLSHAIKVIYTQSRRPDQVIVVDDASTDNSRVILQRLKQTYPGMELIENNQNQGVVRTLNLGLARSNCDYIYFGSADDFILKGFFKKSMDILEIYPKAPLCSSLSVMINKSNEYTGVIKTPIISKVVTYHAPSKCKKLYCKYGPWFMGNTTIYNRQLLDKTNGFDPDLHSYTDNFTSMVLVLSNGACFIPEVLAVWRRGEHGYADRISSNITESTNIYICAKNKLQNEYKDVVNERVYEYWDRRMRFSILSNHIERSMNISRNHDLSLLTKGLYKSELYFLTKTASMGKYPKNIAKIYLFLRMRIKDLTGSISRWYSWWIMLIYENKNYKQHVKNAIIQ